MLYLRNTNQVQTIDNRKNIGGREVCYYGFVTNASYISSYPTPPGTRPTTPEFKTWYYFPCDSPTQVGITLGAGGGQSTAPGAPTASVGPMSSTRFTIPSQSANGPNRPNQLFFSPFPVETQFTQSMTEYEYVTFCALGSGSLTNDSLPWALASYIPSGSNKYTYTFVQLIPYDQSPGGGGVLPGGTPLLGPIAIVSGSAYYSTSYGAPQGESGSGSPFTTVNQIIHAPYP